MPVLCPTCAAALSPPAPTDMLLPSLCAACPAPPSTLNGTGSHANGTAPMPEPLVPVVVQNFDL